MLKITTKNESWATITEAVNAVPPGVQTVIQVKKKVDVKTQIKINL